MTLCHLSNGNEGLNQGQALPETDQAEREKRIAVRLEPVRPCPVRVQGEDAEQPFLKVMQSLKVTKTEPLTTRKREFLNYLDIRSGSAALFVSGRLTPDFVQEEAVLGGKALVSLRGLAKKTKQDPDKPADLQPDARADEPTDEP